MKIIHFSDLHLGVESYGRIDPDTGLPSRLLDFLSALDQVVDYALETKVDLVLFCGDAYKSREPSQTQQREFARRINRLAIGGVPIFLLVGNHDLPNAIGRATSTEIFDTLAIDNVYVSNRPDVYNIPTASGPVQIVSLPWLRRSALLSREDTRNLTFEEINRKMQSVLTNIISTSAANLDPTKPAVLAAHAWVASARVGSESAMTIGQEHTLLLSSVANPAFDYIALGHIHRHQVMSTDPPVVYAGSLARLDFSEEDDDKGFYLVEIGAGASTTKRQTNLTFHPLSGRRFLTINAEIEADDPDPTTTILATITEHRNNLREAIVRLNINLPVELEGQLRDGEIKDALKETGYFTIARNTRRESRLRLGKWTAEELPPLAALKAYLESSQISAERTKLLLEYGERLIKEEETAP